MKVFTGRFAYVSFMNVHRSWMSYEYPKHYECHTYFYFRFVDEFIFVVVQCNNN